MSERRKTHNGREQGGNFRVKQEDFEDKRDDVEGPDLVRDDVRLGGAVADTGPQAGQRGDHVQELVDENREITEKTGEFNRGL